MTTKLPPIKLSKRQLIIAGGGAAIVIVLIALIALNMRPKASSSATAVKLNVWGTENSAAFTNFASAYPYATVNYTQIDPANYSSELLAALAAGNGPDVFEIGNRALPKWESVLAPMPTSTTFGMLQLSQDFPDVVAQDFVSGGQLYGLPFSIDTLAMVYNKDLFNSAGIAEPPATWNEFDADVAKLRKVNAAGQVQVAGAAIGGSAASVPNAPDLLALLMLQNGAQMTNSENNAATFASPSNGSPGLTAFNFYLQFANPASPYYTWSDGMGNAFDSFAAGKTAIMFAYHSDLATIKAKAPFLNYGIAPMPQPKGATISINYPKYDGFVAAKAGNAVAAWNFILYSAALSDSGSAFAASLGEPPALRAAIQADENDPQLSVFATQALSARSWYDGNDAAADAALNTAITNVLTGAEDPTRALLEAQTTVSQLIQQ